MKFIVALLLSFVCSMHAYTMIPKTIRSNSVLLGVKSKSVPFLEAPKNLGGGLVGDKGFDPLGFTDYLPVNYLREAEIKHGRTAMLGSLGFIATDFVKLPGDIHNVSPLAAHDAFVQNGAMFQILCLVVALEAVSIVAIKQMMDGKSKRAAGDYGLELFGYDKANDKTKADLQLKELENGRLAMIAFGGMITQSALFYKGFPYY